MIRDKDIISAVFLPNPIAVWQELGTQPGHHLLFQTQLCCWAVLALRQRVVKQLRRHGQAWQVSKNKQCVPEAEISFPVDRIAKYHFKRCLENTFKTKKCSRDPTYAIFVKYDIYLCQMPFNMPKDVNFGTSGISV